MKKLKFELKVLSKPGHLILEAILENTLDHPIEFCKFATPFESISTQIFTIKNSNKEKLQYHGILCKRIPSEEDYIRLEPGEIWEYGDLRLDECYNFDEGGYTIKCKFLMYDRLSKSFIKCKSNKLKIEIL